MPTSARIIADSVSEAGARLTTFVVRAPRFILPQLSKHRVFSISCRSSRAVPVKKMIQELRDDPVIPRFGKAQPGMAAPTSVGDQIAAAARDHWLDARDDAIEHAEELVELGVAKETANRLLEPFGQFDAVISSTDYLNFFSLRITPNPGEVQVEMRDLALAMARSMKASTPTPTPVGRWHLPYVTDEERRSLDNVDLLAISAARCARVSFRPHGESAVDLAKDSTLAFKLAMDRHWVPFEHQGTPLGDPRERSGNFVGFRQARQIQPNSVATSFNWSLVD